MGFHFRVKHTNLVAYVTTPAAEPPRATRDELYEFAGAFAMVDPHAFLVSRDDIWLDRIGEAGRRILRRVDAIRERELFPDQVASILEPIRGELSGYDLYGLVVPPLASYTEYKRWRRGSLTAASAHYLAIASGGDALLLFPQFIDDPLDIRQLDALPAATALEASSHQSEPGLVLWTSRGTATFVPERKAEDFVAKLLATLRTRSTADIDRLLEETSSQRQRRILHLSDLHFGTDHAAHNLPLLEAELFDVVRAADRVTITGDLFDSPGNHAAASFRAFRLNLERISRAAPLVVPGNHDQRILGNIGQSFEQISQIPWAPVVVDENMETIFVHLNSSIAGNFARGRVTSHQLTSVGAELRSALAKHPRTRHFLRVALVHHHPFPFATQARTLVQRMLGLAGLSEETFLRLEDADEFLDWCARWELSIVLHGHKHAARFETQTISPEGARPHAVTAVGCGSSLGAEGHPLSYNIIYWDEANRRWGARFFESRGGGPFLPKLISTTRALNMSASDP